MSISRIWARLSLPALPKGSLRAHWVRGIGAGVALNGASLLLGFLSGVLAARLLGAEGLGQYAFTLAVVGIASVPASLGLPTIMARYLSIYQSRQAWGLAHGLTRRANQWVGLMGGLLGLIVILIGAFAWDGQRFWLFALAAPLITLLGWTSLRQKSLQGLHHPVAAQLPEQLVKHSAFLGLVSVLMLAGYSFLDTPQGLMVVWLLASFLTFFTGVVLLRVYANRGIRTESAVYQSGTWIRSALPLMLADSIGVIFGFTDILLLGVLGTDTEVGQYQVAVRTAGLMGVFLTASNWVLAPWFARMHEDGERERLQRLVTGTIRLVFAVSLILFTVFILWGEEMLFLFFGPEFVAAYGVLLILASAGLFNVAAGPVVSLLAMTGGQRTLAKVVGLSAVLNFIGCTALIPQFGILGAAVSTALAIVFYDLVLAIIVRRHLGIGPSIMG